MNATTQAPLADLLAATARGDRAAFAELYRLTSPKLFAVTLRIAGRRDKAEEALQEAFVRVWQNAREYRPEQGAPYAWLVSIARYRAIDLLRRERPALNLDDLPQREEWIDPAPDPLANATASDEARRLHRCLDRLEEKARRAVVLAYYRGLTHEELALRLGAPLGTVKTWLRRSLMRLKECLAS